MREIIVSAAAIGAVGMQLYLVKTVVMNHRKHFTGYSVKMVVINYRKHFSVMSSGT